MFSKGVAARFRGVSQLRVVLPPALALCSAAAFAQAPADAETTRADLPTKLEYSSAIGTYQGYADQQVQSWREANDKVGAIGGWRAYAREGQAGKSAPTGEGARPQDPHAGHHGRGTP